MRPCAVLCVGEQTRRACARYKGARARRHSAAGLLDENARTMMIRPKSPRPSPPNSLSQQQSDFTAEGSPPPGKVAAASPVTPKKTATMASKVAAPAHRKGPPAGKSRWQR